jgi:hypothetical protein
MGMSLKTSPTLERKVPVIVRAEVKAVNRTKTKIINNLIRFRQRK